MISFFFLSALSVVAQELPPDDDCVYGNWVASGTCDAACGQSGMQLYTRLAFGDTCNPPQSQVEMKMACTGPACECQYTAWADFGKCEGECSGNKKGLIHRTRSVTSGGDECYYAIDTYESCDVPNCSGPCVYGEWTSFGVCSGACGGTGKQYQTRKVVSGPDYCSETPLQEVTCTTDPCNCEYSEWVKIGSCDAPCGGSGFVKQTRYELWNTAGCTQTESKVACDGQPCGCEYGEWTSEGECTGECGEIGSQFQYRSVKSGRFECYDTASINRYNTCSVPPCTQCTMGAWAAFGECTAECGKTGMQKYTRVATGTGCTEPTMKEERCVGLPCPKDCKYGEWTPAGECSADKCGEKGKQLQVRGSSAPGCPEPLSREIDCSWPCTTTNTTRPAVPAVACKWGEWAAWGACSVACGDGSKTRQRTILTPASAGGTPCVGEPGEIVPCKQTPCASGCQKTDCEMTQWSAWTPCYVVGGDKCKGEQTRQRSISTPAACSGKPCDVTNAKQACDPTQCVGQPGYVSVSVRPPGAVTNANGNIVNVPRAVTGMNGQTVKPGSTTAASPLGTAAIIGISVGGFCCCCICVVCVIVIVVMAMRSSNNTKNRDFETSDDNLQMNVIGANSPAGRSGAEFQSAYPSQQDNYPAAQKQYPVNMQGQPVAVGASYQTQGYSEMKIAPAQAANHYSPMTSASAQSSNVSVSTYTGDVPGGAFVCATCGNRYNTQPDLDQHFALRGHKPGF